jgi:uncharacterized membrane protein YraQ (UPF0718 family)/YHS domain-containing protein
MEKDPICGMSVKKENAVRVTHEGRDYFFCSVRCKDKFLQEKGMPGAAVCLPEQQAPWFRNKLVILTACVALLVSLSFFFSWLVPFRKILSGYVKTIWWAVLLGLFLGGIIDYYIPREYISKMLSRRSPRTILHAVFLGFCMSACSHGILALSIQLHKKGASNPAVVSFLLASPWANLTITVMLVSFFGLKGFFIIGGALVIAVTTGFIYMLLESKRLIETNKNTISVSDDFSIVQDVKKRMRGYSLRGGVLKRDANGVFQGMISLADMVLWWIILGVVLASLAGAFIPVHFFHKFMGPTFLGLAITLLLATVIEVCSEGSSPLAFEIYRQTHAMGNSFVFLMAGVATDYTEIGLLWTNVGRRVALWLPIVTVPQIFALGYCANYFLR